MEENKTTEATVESIVTPVVEDDAEARIARLEEEKENYRKAYLKSESKRKESDDSESDDDRIQRIVDERLAQSNLARITKEQDEIISKALKENKELKLALANKPGVSVSTGIHSEGRKVTDTLITADQLAFFKAKGWDEKTIELYKKNLLKKV